MKTRFIPCLAIMGAATLAATFVVAHSRAPGASAVLGAAGSPGPAGAPELTHSQPRRHAHERAHRRP